MRTCRRLIFLLLGLTVLLTSPPAHGQGSWTADLNFDPFPSPYISDWENNPAIGQAFITNGSADTVRVRVYLTLYHDTRGKIASANSRLFAFPPGQPTSLTTKDLIDDQSIDYDHSIREIAVRTGRIPEGKYRICARLEDESGVTLLDNQCAEFTIVYPDPPYLVYPSNGESITNKYPVLQWTPVQVPVGFQVHYDLQMVEVLQGQSPAQALVANYPQYRNSNISGASQQYPIEALPLQKGKTYAWQVQVLDDKGYPPSSNNGRSEIWTFQCDIDTTTPVELRHLTGRVLDSATNAALGSARVVYRSVRRSISGKDTTWTDGNDSLVFITGADGAFTFDSAVNKSFYSLSVTRAEYRSVHLSGQSYYQSGDIANFKIGLSLAPPGNRRLAGVVRDFYSNEPVPNIPVVYQVVDAQVTTDSSGKSSLSYKENPRKKLQTVSDDAGRFEFLQAADSSFFSLRATKPPSYLPAVDMGPDQRQVGDIDDYILLVKPNAGCIAGTIRTIIGGKTIPVPKAMVQLTRTAQVSIKVTFMGFTQTASITVIDTAVASAYSNADGDFRIQRISQEKPSTTRTAGGTGVFSWLKSTTTTTYESYSYRVVVNDNRYRPYISPDSITVAAGETTESGEHLLTPKSGSIVGRILCDTLAVAGAKVYLYPSACVPLSSDTATSGTGQSKSGAESTPTGLEGTDGGSTEDTTWGNVTSQRPDGEPLDMYQTGQDGVYGFAAVPINDPAQVTERYTIWVEADGYNPGARGDRLGSENKTDTVNFNLGRVGGVIYGHTKDGAGSEITNVRVELQRSDTASGGTLIWLPNPAWVASGGDASYSFGDISPGLYRLQFSKSGFNTLASDTIRIDYGDKLLYEATLSAAKGFIQLTVKDKDDKKVSDVCVKATRIPALLAFTDKDGKLLISEAPADSVTLQLRKLGYADLDTAVVVKANDTVKFEVKIEKSVGQVLVRVVEKGHPEKRLSGMKVKIGKDDSESKKDKDKSDSDDKKAKPDTTDYNGEIIVDEAPTGQQTVTVTPPTDSSYELDYAVVETQTYVYPGLNAKPLIIEMEPAARIQGTVKNKEGAAPLSGVTVTIEGNSKAKAETDASGVFKLRNVPTGESVTLKAVKAGFRSARFKYDKPIAAGDKITGISIELEKSPMDSLFGFPIALDSSAAGSNGHTRVWGTLTSVPATMGLKLRNETTPISFANLEVDSAYKPLADSVLLTQKEVEISLFGIDGKMTNDGGLCLKWVDSVKAGRISGTMTILDPISKAFPESKFLDLTIPRKYAPSFWAGGVNHGLDKYGLTSTDKEVQVKIKAVTVGIDFTRSNVDSAGIHLFGSIQFGANFKVGFEEMIIGRDASGDITLKAISITTKPAIKIPFGVFTVVDSSMTWEATGFRASGAIVLNALDNKEFGFKDLRISPKGEFLSLTVTADEKNGTINVYGQKFQIEKLEFGTESFASDTAPHTKYFAFTGKLGISKLDKPVGMNLRYTENGLFTGKLDFNQSRSFGGIVTISLESIELGYDSSKTDRFVGLSGGVKFSSIVGLNLQASNLRFYFSGDVSFDKIAMDFSAGPVNVKLSVSYLNSVFEGKGWFEVKPVISAGAEFRYGGPKDWWVRIISGTRIPIGPCEIVQASGGVGRKDDTWKFSVGGIVAPAKADKGIRLDILVEVQKTPQGVIILGNAGVEVASGTQVGKATIEINIPERRVNGSIVFAMDFKAVTAKAQLDLGVKFGEYWYVYGRASIDVLKFFKNDGIIVVANNWQWQHDGKTQLMSGIYVELNSMFKVDANWYVVKWGVNFDRHAMVYIGWNGDFAGSIDMKGGAYAWIGFGPFDLIQAKASMALAAHLSYIEPEWTAGARGSFNLEGSIGSCSGGRCWSLCWKCFVRIFGHCIFALPTGAKACIGMNAYIEYATSKGMTWDISF